MITLKTIRQASRALGVTASIVAASVVPALAQPTAQAPSWSAGDRAFVASLLQQSRAQLALAHLALGRTSGFIAPSAAHEAATEWSDLRSRLLGLAYAAGAPVRGSLSTSERATLAGLGRQMPSSVNDAYLRAALRGDRLVVQRMQSEHGTRNPQVRQFLAYALPLVESYEATVVDDMPHDEAPSGSRLST